MFTSFTSFTSWEKPLKALTHMALQRQRRPPRPLFEAELSCFCFGKVFSGSFSLGVVFFRILPGFRGQRLCLWRSGLQSPKRSQACIECLVSFYVAFCLFVLLAGEKRVLAVLAPTVRLWSLHEDSVLRMCMFVLCLLMFTCMHFNF